MYSGSSFSQHISIPDRYDWSIHLSVSGVVVVSVRGSGREFQPVKRSDSLDRDQVLSYRARFPLDFRGGVTQGGVLNFLSCYLKSGDHFPTATDLLRDTLDLFLLGQSQQTTDSRARMSEFWRSKPKQA